MTKSKDSSANILDLLTDEERQSIIMNKVGSKFAEILNEHITNSQTVGEFVEALQAEPFFEHMASINVAEVLAAPSTRKKSRKARTKRAPLADTMIAGVKAFLKKNAGKSVSEIAAALPGIAADDVKRALKKLRDEKAVTVEGEKRSMKYSLAA